MNDSYRCDFHIHTAYLGCADETMKVVDIVRECERLGLRRIGITDQYVEEYMEYLAVIADEGACFAFGSDAHSIGRLGEINAVTQAAERLNLPPERIWTPEGAPRKASVKG